MEHIALLTINASELQDAKKIETGSTSSLRLEVSNIDQHDTNDEFYLARDNVNQKVNATLGEPASPDDHSNSQNASFSPSLIINESATEKLKLGAQNARKRKVRNYYDRQLSLVDNYKDDSIYLHSFFGNSSSRHQINDASAKIDYSGAESKSRHREVLLTRLTLLVNLVLFIAKILAAVLSGSLVVLSSVVDSAMDLTTGAVMFCTTRAINKRNLQKYPRGRTRLEPLALIVISVVMGAANVQVVVQSVEAIISKSVNPHVDPISLIIMCSTVVLKIGLFIMCYTMQGSSAMVRVLMQDHRNDCISNSVAVVCAFLATRYWVYLDPIAAILVSFYIIGTWVKTGFHHVAILSGKTATPDMINRIVKVCVDHRPKVLSVDTVYAYHFGLKYLVEVHVVLDENISLKESHDISEPLQRKIEHLPYVERAFVHVDYDTIHRPEEEHKIV